MGPVSHLVAQNVAPCIISLWWTHEIIGRETSENQDVPMFSSMNRITKTGVSKSSAEFSFKPHQTHFNQLVKVFRITRNLQADVLGWWATFWAILPGNFFWAHCLGTFPLRMGNKFLFGYFRSVVGLVSHLVARWWQYFPKLPKTLLKKLPRVSSALEQVVAKLCRTQALPEQDWTPLV